MMPHRAPEMSPDGGGNQPAGGLVFLASTSDAPEMSLEVPKRPFKGQKTKDCDTDASEQFINGGCWVETSKKAPCGDKQYEYRGKCYRPIGQE
ncbi:hypothetical protein [Corallococcus silvisoli]|uniref:hypothetical protein n=1 Tax=Corallococcus silvisoli TaxID=2697031 RepID=UPI001376F288|nr:hypothetical protein [Corallococcus silvisoli]NBD09282.1 hypothetical protein [Corallococcus silvisoli]